MSTKRDVRMAYYNGLKAALDDHIEKTESGLRDLPGLSTKKLDKLLATVRKQHEKLLKRIDHEFAEEVAEDQSLAPDA